MTAAAFAAAIAGVAAGGWWLRTRLMIVTVCGPSMEPSLADGDRLLVRRTLLKRLGRGAMVVVTMPTPPLISGGPSHGVEWMVKRATALPGDPVPAGVPAADQRVPAGHFVVIGDNPHGSYDSRAVGCLPATALVGVVVRRVG